MTGDSLWRRYLTVGALSLVKAAVVRRNRRRLRAELADAGLFIGVGLLVRRLEGGRAGEPSRLKRAVRQLEATDTGNVRELLGEAMEGRDLRGSLSQQQESRREKLGRRVRIRE